jgi:hypothetical protein
MWAQGKITGIRVVTLGLMLSGCEASKNDVGVTAVESQAVGQPAHDKHKNKPKHCKVVDAWEPNPTVEEATLMIWEEVATEEEVGSDYVRSYDIPAYLCAGEEDWYYFETANLGYQDPYMLLFVELGGGDHCQAACGNPAVEPGPKYALIGEIYRADTMDLLESQESYDGEIFLGGQGEFNHDLVIRVYSPNAHAKYAYTFSVLVHEGSYGDDCEC